MAGIGGDSCGGGADYSGGFAEGGAGALDSGSDAAGGVETGVRAPGVSSDAGGVAPVE